MKVTVLKVVVKHYRNDELETAKRVEFIARCEGEAVEVEVVTTRPESWHKPTAVAAMLTAEARDKGATYIELDRKHVYTTHVAIHAIIAGIEPILHGTRSGPGGHGYYGFDVVRFTLPNY